MPYIISAIIILLFIVALFILAIAILNSAGVNKRCEGDENLKYLKAKNFDNLNALPVNFKSDK